MPQVSEPRCVLYDDAREQIAEGDLLLFRRRGLISIAGRGVHSHAAKAAWWDGDLFCVEIREWFGGRAVTLSSQVERYPGRIDVFETNPDGRWPGLRPRRQRRDSCGVWPAATTAGGTWLPRRWCICRGCGSWSERT